MAIGSRFHNRLLYLIFGLVALLSISLVSAQTCTQGDGGYGATSDPFIEGGAMCYFGCKVIAECVGQCPQECNGSQCSTIVYYGTHTGESCTDGSGDDNGTDPGDPGDGGGTDPGDGGGGTDPGNGGGTDPGTGGNDGDPNWEYADYTCNASQIIHGTLPPYQTTDQYINLASAKVLEICQTPPGLYSGAYVQVENIKNNYNKCHEVRVWGYAFNTITQSTMMCAAPLSGIESPTCNTQDGWFYDSLIDKCKRPKNNTDPGDGGGTNPGNGGGADPGTGGGNDPGTGGGGDGTNSGGNGTGGFCEGNSELWICKNGQFGGTCQTDFTCDGDPIFCATARAINELNCQYKPVDIPSSLLSDINEGNRHLDNATTEREIDFTSIFNSVLTFNEAGTCPSPRIVSVLGTSFDIDYDPFCKLAPIVSFVVMFASIIISLRILSGA